MYKHPHRSHPDACAHVCVCGPASSPSACRNARRASGPPSVPYRVDRYLLLPGHISKRYTAARFPSNIPPPPPPRALKLGTTCSHTVCVWSPSLCRVIASQSVHQSSDSVNHRSTGYRGISEKFFFNSISKTKEPQFNWSTA